jgi:hypothetical protein
MSILYYSFDASPIAIVTEDKITKEILSFTSLRAGWHYGSGVAPKIDIATAALSVAGALRDLGIVEFEAFPETRGGILVIGYQNNTMVEAMVTRDKNLNITVEVSDHEVFSREGIQLDELVSILGGSNWLSGRSFASCIHGTTVIDKDALHHWRLAPPMMTTASLSYGKGASTIVAQTSAPTSPSTTAPQFPASRRYFGDSTIVRFQ